jgi:hypothetical protein
MNGLRVFLCAFAGATLAGCTPPLDWCIAQATRDQRAVERRIAEAEANLARGYAIDEVEVTESRYVLCRDEPGNVLSDGVTAAPSAGVSLCWEDFTRLERRRRAIEPAEERHRLAALRSEAAALARAAAPAVAACRARYPQG